MFWSYEIVEWPAHDCGGRKDTIVGAIFNIAIDGEAIENQERARRLSGKAGITRGPVGKKIVYAKGL